jgi:hypothetical protein
MAWTAKQRAFQHYLARPNGERDRGRIAAELGVTPELLARWEEKKGFWAEVNRLAREEAERALASVWGSLISKARKGEVAAIKLLFSLLGQPSSTEDERQPVQFKFIVENGNGGTITADIPAASHTKETGPTSKAK